MINQKSLISGCWSLVLKVRKLKVDQNGENFFCSSVWIFINLNVRSNFNQVNTFIFLKRPSTVNMTTNLTFFHPDFVSSDNYNPLSLFPIIESRRPRFLEDSLLEDGLDPVEYIKQVRTKKKGKGRRLARTFELVTYISNLVFA